MQSAGPTNTAAGLAGELFTAIVASVENGWQSNRRRRLTALTSAAQRLRQVAALTSSVR